MSRGADGTQAGQGLREVAVDRGQGDALQPLELAGSVAVISLDGIVQKTQRKEDRQDHRQAVTDHHQHAQQTKDVGQEYIEYEGQEIIHAVHIRGESIDDASNWCAVKESYRGLMWRDR